MAKFTGELPLERTGDETVNHINPDMGPVLREVLRDQKRVQGLKRGNLKVTCATGWRLSDFQPPGCAPVS